MDIPLWHYIASMTAYLVFLLVLIDVMRKHTRLAFVAVIFAVLSFPFWNEVEGWFRWAKILSVLVPMAFVVGPARLAWYYKDNQSAIAKFYRGNWTLFVLYGVLFLNIAEATLKDFQTANYMNAICGVILCATIPWPSYKGGKHQYWLFDPKRPNDLLFYSTHAWNFLYTTWNMCFVYGESPAFFFSSACILVAAELYPVLKKRPELYIIARIYTLAAHVLIRGIYDVFTPVMNSEPIFDENALMIWGAINLVLHVPFAIWYFRKQRADKEAPFGHNEPPLRSQAA